MPIRKPNRADIIRHVSVLFRTITATAPILIVLLVPVWFIESNMLIYATFFALLAISPLILCTVSDRGIVLFKWHYHGIPTAAEEAHKEDMNP